MVEQVGTCYEDAWRFQMRHDEGSLVHGEITGADGVTVKHAWVELPTGFIYEPQTARFFKADGFKIAFNPVEDVRYTVEEAAIMLTRVGKHGPWMEQERQLWLKRGNPIRPKSKVFYETTTDMPHYDQLLDPTKAEYFAREKGEKGTIIWVTPDEALAKGAEIHGVSIEEELRVVNEEAISKYTEIMKQGEKFPLPVLDYKRKDQEGRHRILAAKRAGETRIPVLVVEEVTTEVVEQVKINQIRNHLAQRYDWLKPKAEAKRYIIKEEPEPLYKSGRKYVAYYEDGTPRYLAAETKQGLKTRLLEAEPDAEFVTPAVGGNPDRVRFDRASIDSAITAAKRLQSEKDLYVFATHLGFTIDSRPPPGVQQYIVVHPDGTTETIKPFESNPTGNPMGKLISEEAAIGMLERLSMTPDEARRSLFGSEEERRAIMIAVQERVKREQNKWAPFDPREGPPLPRIFAGLRWPWKQ